jgi:peptide deformylase
MSVLKVLIFPDQRLRTVAKPVRTINEGIKKLVNDLQETMYKGRGIGLSATQVNIHKRIMVIDVSPEKDSPLTLINPEINIIEPKEKKISEEGCLSVPGFYEEVERPSKINVIALNEEGQKINIKAEGLLAVAIQHEMDHLEGRIFLDYLSNLKRQIIRKKLMKSFKETA